MPDLGAAVMDHGEGDIEHDGEPDPGQPAEPVQQPCDQAGGDAHERHGNQQPDGEHRGMLTGGAGNGEHIVQAHGNIGDDDAPDGGAQAAFGLDGDMVFATVQFARGFPDHPEEQYAPGQREADEGKQLKCDKREADADDCGAGDAGPDSPGPLMRRQTVDSQPDNDGVVTGEHKVDEEDLEQDRNKGEIYVHPVISGVYPGCLSTLKRKITPNKDFQGARMIPRYTRPQAAAIWAQENKYRIWYEIEALACEGMAAIGAIPAEAAVTIRERGDKKLAGIGPADVERIDEIERETRHDVIAFLTWLAEGIGEPSRFVHQGLTSSDVLDTCFAVQLTQSADLLLRDLDDVLAALKKRAIEHKNTLTIGRSHGIHAEPTSFGLKLAGHYAEFARNRVRLVAARAEIATCAISGAVGTFAHVDPRVEEYVAARLGLAAEPVSTQVIPRDRHAAFFATLGVIACGIERLATEVRHLQRSEVREAEEFFHAGQKGSSAMPHKRNPVLSENLSGLARLVRATVIPAMENVALWHERDISHSSVERGIGPDATVTLDFALSRLAGMIDKLTIYPERMHENLESLGGVVHSGEVLLALTKSGILREDAYKIVQRNAMATWTKLGQPGAQDFKANLLADPEVAGRVSAEVIDAAMASKMHLAQVDTIFARVFGPA